MPEEGVAPPQQANSGQTMQGQMGTTPNQGGQTVVPGSQIQQGAQGGGIIGALKNAFKMK